jgi:hypothetical protein
MNANQNRFSFQLSFHHLGIHSSGFIQSILGGFIISPEPNCCIIGGLFLSNAPVSEASFFAA